MNEGMRKMVETIFLSDLLKLESIQIPQTGDIFEIEGIKFKLTNNITNASGNKYLKLRRIVLKEENICKFCGKKGNLTISARILQYLIETPIPCCFCKDEVYGRFWFNQKRDYQHYNKIYEIFKREIEFGFACSKRLRE